MAKISAIGKSLSSGLKKSAYSVKSSVGLGGMNMIWVIIGVVIIIGLLLYVYYPRGSNMGENFADYPDEAFGNEDQENYANCNYEGFDDQENYEDFECFSDDENSENFQGYRNTPRQRQERARKDEELRREKEKYNRAKIFLSDFYKNKDKESKKRIAKNMTGMEEQYYYDKFGRFQSSDPTLMDAYKGANELRGYMYSPNIRMQTTGASTSSSVRSASPSPSVRSASPSPSVRSVSPSPAMRGFAPSPAMRSEAEFDAYFNSRMAKISSIKDSKARDEEYLKLYQERNNFISRQVKKQLGPTMAPSLAPGRCPPPVCPPCPCIAPSRSRSPSPAPAGVPFKAMMMPPSKSLAGAPVGARKSSRPRGPRGFDKIFADQEAWNKRKKEEADKKAMDEILAKQRALEKQKNDRERQEREIKEYKARVEIEKANKARNAEIERLRKEADDNMARHRKRQEDERKFYENQKKQNRRRWR